MQLGNGMNVNETCHCMLMRKCFLAMLVLMLVILMLMLLNLNTGYADTDADLRIRIMCCTVLGINRGNPFCLRGDQR